MIRRCILIFVILVILPINSHSITLEDYGVTQGDEFSFYVHSAGFREYHNGGLVNNLNGFYIYNVFMVEKTIFYMNIEEINDVNFVAISFHDAQSTETLNDDLNFLVRNTDWDDYIEFLESQQLQFDLALLNNEISGSFEIIDSSTEIGYRMESEYFEMNGDQILNESISEVVRFDRSSGVIWERSYSERIEFSIRDIQFIDILYYTFWQNGDSTRNIESRVIIPGFTIIWTSFSIIILYSIKKAKVF